jgi:type IV pilus assembly protein PilV
VRVNAAHGFMLLEVLVALTLTALGIAAWLQGQATALQQSRTSAHRTMALMLATELAEILRASPAQAPTMAHAGAFAEPLPVSVSACQPSSCDASAWSLAELAQWRDRVRQALPSGSSQLSVDPLARRARITLGWREAVVWELLGQGPAYLRCPASWSSAVLTAGPVSSPSSGSLVRCLLIEVAW